jgi:predicted dehydrogenase
VNPKIGLVGVGPWGRHILRDLNSLGAEVHAVARSPESIARARDGEARSIVDDPEKLPADCDAYVIANRTTSHLDAIEPLLPRGRPMFVEKPIAPDVARVKRLPDYARERIFIMHKWRYHPGVLEMQRIAASGDYGPVEGLRTFRLGWGNPHRDANSLWILAPHDFSIALQILGEVPTLVTAAPDPADLSGGGAIAHLRTRAGVPFSMELSAGHPSRLRRIMLRCRDALCQLDDSDYAAIRIHKIGETEPRVIRVSDELPLLAELRAFLDHVKGGPAPATGLAEEIKIIEQIARIEAMIRSE